MIVNIANKQRFVKNFLTPINKINEDAVVKINDNSITSLTCTGDAALFLNCIYTQQNSVNDSLTLNIPDISKLINAINCVNNEEMAFEYENNSIKYSSDDINFKLHLLEDGIISAPAVNVDKLKNIKFDTSFEIDYQNFTTLVKGSTFATDTNKIYFSTRDGCVYGELTDKENQNINSFSSIICEEFEGEGIKTPAPLDFEVIRMLLGIRFDTCKIHLSTKLNVFLFDISDSDYKINFIASGLRK